MSLISNPKPGDDVSVRQAMARLGSSKLGPTSTPKFLGVTTTTLTITGLTTNALIYPVSGLLTSLGAATNGQIPIGSTGVVPVLAGITGTANQVVSTPGAGSITLSTPQDIHAAASNFTVAGETVTDLTASRLMSSSGAKVLSSVSDLTSWIAGTTDHISVADDSDGTVTLDLDTNTKILLGSFNGIFLEKLNFTVSKSGATVIGSLERDSGGDLTQKFSDGYTVLDTTPALTIDLTAYVGTDAVPKEVFVYILRSAKTVIAASNVDWPVAVEHCKIAHLVLKSVSTTGADGGALVNQNHNDYAFDDTGEGHIQDIEHRLRQEPAVYDSGLALTLKNVAGAELTTGNSSTRVYPVTEAGEVFQLHRHTFPAFDMYATATDDAHIVNQPTDEGGAYLTTTDLVADITHYVDGTAAGVAIGINKYFNLVVWGVQNRSGTPSHIMLNLPTGQYTISGNAVADVDGLSIFDIPSAFKGTGFLIARLTFRKIGGSQWTYIAQEDLRGKFPDIIAGVGITTTDHALLANLTAPADDHTQYLLADGTRALAGAWDMGGQILTNVNIDTGDINTAVVNTEWDAAFAHVSNDGSDHSFIDQSVLIAASPTFVGMTLSGDLSLGFGDLVSEQNPDAVNAIRLKGTASDVDVVIGDVTGYFSVWNTADDNAVFHVNDRGNTDIAGDLIVEGALAGAWDMGSQILTNVNIDTGDINVAVTNTEWDAAFTHVSTDGSSHSIVGSNTTAISLNTTHRTSNGSDHSYLDQAVTIAGSPSFANLSLGIGELTAGSINRASGALTLEIGGIAEQSITATATTFGGNIILPASGTIGVADGSPSFFLDNVNNFIGVGTLTPQKTFHIVQGEGAYPAWSTGEILVLQNNSVVGNNCRIVLLSGNTGACIIEFGDTQDRDDGQILYDQNTNALGFRVNAVANRLQIDSSGNIKASGNTISDSSGNITSANGANFGPSAVASITVVNGIVTAIS